MLLVYRVDRLSRKVRQLAQLAEELDTVHVVLRSATEPFDTGSAAGRMMLQMLAVFAEFEHATIVDRISAGIERRAKEGRWFGGRPPFGYVFSNEERVLVPDPVKAPVVRRVFDLYARKRLGTRTIAQQLREEDAPSPSAGWGHPAVHWIINNPTYVGKIRWHERVFDGVHEPLVDEFTFAKAQAIMRERGEHAKRRGNASDFVLSGLLRCGRCGKAYIGMSANGNGGRYHYYACSGRQKYGPKACDGERLPRDKVEQAVVHQLISLYRDEQLIGDALAKANAAAEKRRPEFEQRLASVGAEIARAERALERYYEAFERGKLSPERCEDRLTRLQSRLDDLHAQQAELELEAPHAANSAPTVADLAEVADLVEEVIAEADPQKTKPLLQLLIDGLRVNSRAEILPTYRLVTPAVCAMSEKVGRAGIEPATLGLKVPCSTN
jgi:site-specific DNA recombinase